MKRLFYTIAVYTLTSFVYAAKADEPPLTHELLKTIDGKAGFFDGKKAKESLWLMREIRSIQGHVSKENGKEIVNYGSLQYINGKMNPAQAKPGEVMERKELTFRGEKQTIKSLIALESKAASFTPAEKKEMQELFAQVKDYFDQVNQLSIASARGAEGVMIKLIREYCRKNNRMNSLLVKWDPNKGTDNELYRNEIINFSSFYVFTTDLLNFTAALLKSCPKAYAEARASHKKS